MLYISFSRVYNTVWFIICRAIFHHSPYVRPSFWFYRDDGRGGTIVTDTVARIMSITLKIGIWGGWLTPQLEKKFKLLYPYRNIWMHQIQVINANNCHASANVFTIYSIFWIWMLRIGPASRNKILVFCCQYLVFLQSFWH